MKVLNVFSGWLQGQISLQSGQGILWAPIWLGCGIAAYFALPTEPEPYLGAAIFALMCGVLLTVRKRAVFWWMLPVAFVALGFTAAQWRAAMVIAASLAEDIKFARISGVVTEIDIIDIERGQLRFVLDDVAIEKLEQAEVPHRVRVTLKASSEGRVYRIGDRIEGLAGLSALPTPVVPGGFDFGRHMAFKGIGALGFFYRAPEIIAEGAGAGASLQPLRQAVEARVIAALPPQQAAVTAALLTGKRTGIDDADLDAMRYSGLAHMLAISGLHVGLFSGVVFFVVRLGLVMIPGLALRWPVKKIAAVVAFSAAVFYMLLAGATIPTQRAVLMVGVVFLAVLLDRTALSMRLVAFAAFVVLLIMPESLLSVSFQLSFAAVVALIWVYGLLRGWISGVARQGGTARKAALYLGGVCMTTVIATIATAPFALYHFEQLAVLSVIANVLAMPVMSFVIMPFAVVALAAMAFGLEHLPLWVMGHGVEQVLDIAHFVSAQDYAVLRVAAWPFEAFLAVVLGALLIILVQGRLRWFGLLGFVVAALLIQGARLPDVLIAESHDLWAYKRDGQIYVSARNKERFMRENWERYYGLEAGSAERWDRDTHMACDRLACRTVLKGRKISFVSDIEALEIECAWADIVVSRRSAYGKTCAAAVIVDWQATKRNSTHALTIAGDNGAVGVDHVRAHLGRRLWNK